jgi:hypothetical protein
MQVEYDYEYEVTCQICHVILDRFDDNTFTCNDIHCIRTWEDQCDLAEDRRIERIKQKQEY